ncbi:hypothetical protein EPVG_00430 [Emiliania huxleyi virus 201]|nr:hypothetical protein ELVG_00414 [Emiliania huxleyi virus 203]AEP15810.1 hypothetical protein EQVG_00401 [Emiliania huxleyi virus 207]AEP16187.1 hypothetical protein ERVG_00312 [Emiliania huxleyi virus 208]AET98317.1 hypothetical protein EPVG_00430 [Emiliania huxleyi virus 201]
MAMNMYGIDMFGKATETSLAHECVYRHGKTRTSSVIVYIWHTKCPHCPAKLAQLNNLCKIKKFTAIGVVLETPGNFSNSFQAMDLTMELIDELDVKNINHFFMTTEQKEVAKTELNFKTVPQIFKFNSDELTYTPVTMDYIMNM